MALERLLDLTDRPLQADHLYETIDLPPAPEDRPTIYLNMVSTADGKIVIGPPGATAAGVGGPTDQLLFRRLQRTCDGAMIGASTLRAGPVIYPAESQRFVATRNGDLPLDNRFFRDAPAHAHIIAPVSLDPETKAKLAAGAKLIQYGAGEIDWPAALRYLRQDLGIERLLCEGGGELNFALLTLGLVDELFLTLAPKLKGGRHLPTTVGGTGFAPGHAAPMSLLSIYRDGDEIYLRYRVSHESAPSARHTSE